MAELQKHQVKDLNSVLVCRLCEGYLIDATALVECLHTFCRGCILRYFENNKTQCPVCPAVYKKKTQCFRSDSQIQALVYKLVPSLFVKEMQRREEFYRSTGVRTGSSCSDDSVIDRERDMLNESEEMISQYIGDRNQYFSPEDLISLSLEYYQDHLDTTDINHKNKETNSANPANSSMQDTNTTIEAKPVTPTAEDPNTIVTKDINISESDTTVAKSNGQIRSELGDKRYLQCPAGVNMKHLQKFVRMKYGLTGDHRVDIIYKGEVLPNDFSLMDVAYIYKYEKINPMRFFYRIFTPMKVRPIKIVNTTLSTGGKQLQIVPVVNVNNVNADTTSAIAKSPKIEKAEEKVESMSPPKETASEQEDKERLFAHLRLQSKSKALQNAELKKALAAEKIIKECVFEYEEPDQEEIKRFAEKRDREWALQKKLEEETRPEIEVYSKDYYSSKKRKKSKHSKNESNGHKEKRRKVHGDKIHAEITNNDKTDLKLKVKITTNGHKHKHHKIESNDKSQISNKEKLLQMRQVRHKHLSGSGDEKFQPMKAIIKIPKLYTDKKEVVSENNKYSLGEPVPKKKRENPKVNNESQKINKTIENNNYKESQIKQRIEPMIIKPVSKISDAVNSRPTLTIARPVPRPESTKIVQKEKTSKVTATQMEKSDSHIQKTFLKSATTSTEKYSHDQKVGQNKNEIAKTTSTITPSKVLPIGSISTNNESLDRKIASLQERCTIETKNTVANNIRVDNGKSEKKATFVNEKSKILSPQYPSSFTVRKIDSGAKRKSQQNEIPDKRPSLEITLIQPTSTTPTKRDTKPVAKRPLPGTIPLEKIRNAEHLKSGVSILSKIPERRDNNGVLDLSKSNKSPPTYNSPRSTPKTEPINGLNRQIGIARPGNSPGRNTPETKNIQLSNLQMLSKVATEQSSISKVSSTMSKPNRPQVPNLQTINKTLIQQSSAGIRNPGVSRMPPNLNEIQKFRPMNTQIRSLRPNPNKNIRTIINPSLLNQNRLSANQNVTSTDSTEKKDVPQKPQTQTVSSSSNNSPVPKETPNIKPAIMDQRIIEKKEIPA